MLLALTVSLGIGIPLINTVSFSISLTDVLVAAFLPVALFQMVASRIKWSPTLTDYGTLIFASALLISLVHPGNQNSFLSVFGLLRIVLFYITMRLLMGMTGTTVNPVLNRSFSWMIYLLVGTGLLGLLLFALGVNNPFILVRDYYYGLVPLQLSGTDGHPNGAAELLFISALIVFYTRRVEDQIPWLPLFIALAGLILTQAKSNLVYLGITISIYLASSNSNAFIRRLGYFTAGFLLLFYLLISHWFPVYNPYQAAHENQIPEYLDTAEMIWKGQRYTIYPTHYTTNKKAAWACFKEYPWMGIGPRNYIPFVDSLQEAGGYPATCRFKNPHCMYTGILAKFGLTGLLGWLVLFISILVTVKKIPEVGIRVLFAGLWTVVFFDGWTSDMEYGKVMWFLIAWLASHRNVKFSNVRQEKQTL